MQGLGDTTSRLARLKHSNPMRRPSRDLEGLTETQNFGANPGALRMLTYCPPDLPPSAPLVVVLHGCSQDGESYASDAGWLSLALELGFCVLMAEQRSANNPNRCFNWFQPTDVTRGLGESASIAAMVGHAIIEHRLDQTRVFITGLSAGGAMAAAMLATYPDLFAGGAVIAGLPFGVASSMPDALMAMHRASPMSNVELGMRVRDAGPAGAVTPRLAIWYGGADSVVSPANGEQLAAQWAAAVGAIGPENIQSGGVSRQIWREPMTKAVLVELNRVPGLGHGAPLATLGPGGVGTTGPYMLEAGVSSSREILRFWDVAPGKASRFPAPRSPPSLNVSTGDYLERPSPPTPERRQNIADIVLKSVSPHVSGRVQDVIAKALRSAGLMK